MNLRLGKGATPLQRYVSFGYKRVDGWLVGIAVDVIVCLAAVQKKLRVHGAASEIGIHHGRLFILLHLLTEPTESSVAWDLFGRQDENFDRSGAGDLEIFRANLTKHGCDLNRIKIRAVNSLALTPSAILNECGGPVRLFSVDGGHTAAATYNDLSLAAGTLAQGGLVILDDFFNPDWPGVAEGAARYLLEHPGSLFPVAIIGNKFIFTNATEMAEVYTRELIARYERGNHCYVKTTPVFNGHAITITPYGAPNGRLRDRMLDYCGNTRLWESIRYSATGRFLKTGLRRIKDI